MARKDNRPPPEPPPHAANKQNGHPEDIHDLGLGRRLTQQRQIRFLNRDGSFNVRRQGLPFLSSLNPYHALLTISWARFIAIVIALHLLINLVFGLAYFLCGRGALGDTGSWGTAPLDRFLESFFFSVQTFSTIGYGGITPRGLAANAIVTVQSLASLLFFATATGLIFARFSRPAARILFSERAVIAPYHGITAFEFRVINTLKSQLINLEIVVVLSRMVQRQGHAARAFDELALERAHVTFFPLHLTVVHPIDDQSPLHGMTPAAMAAADLEFIVLINGFDETFSQVVHTRSSYKYDELAVGARFADMFLDAGDGKASIDMEKFHQIENAVLGIDNSP